ncbi:hypothetical protein CDD80_5618 [Ophiocordyceps camponoti-rufipedis]|uniref:Uncharacterized protein n=1 Tax=Ophiocordyceps camponoti-rufipedis TaxID=2004952 RepID=A0A2C5YVP0_9HYPO|nr:hypothetical protein CDD80_5618 [Ophiocordyceps camponoti-rufipedis]
MPRLVRRKPLRERINAMLNPMDLLLWLSEEVETREWDSQLVGTQLGLGLNSILLLARANSASVAPLANDDLFGEGAPSNWVSLFILPLVWALVIFSLTNAFYAFCRTRSYRLFQASVDTRPATPSARRVKVHSSPASSSPLRLLADLVTSQSAESRAHPDKDKDVWEIAVWDPLPLSMRLLCFFSPGHVLVYLLFLPLAPLDPRPSMTVFNSLVMQLLLTVQMHLLCQRFAQQGKDNTIIQKEVVREYDAKFVHPRLYPVVRDVGTQMSGDETPESVHIGSPTTLLRRGFKTHGNPHIDMPEPTTTSGYMKPQMFTSPAASRRVETLAPSGLRGTTLRNISLPAASSSMVAAEPSQTEGGSFPTQGRNREFEGFFGVYTHNKSPLKKTFTVDDLINQPLPKNSKEMAAWEQHPLRRSASPKKQSSSHKALTVSGEAQANSLANTGRPRPQYERYPSRCLIDCTARAGQVSASPVVQETKQPDKMRRHITSSCRQSSETHGPDRILRWNMARDLPDSRQDTDEMQQPAAGPSRRLRHDVDREKRSPKEAESRNRRGKERAADARSKEPQSSSATDVERQLAQMMEGKKEARRQRRNLKESGDYLGVQGVNPETGQLDIVTPTDSDRSSASQEKQQKLNKLRTALREARQSYRNVKDQSEREARRMMEREANKQRRLDKEKQKLQNLSQRVRWQRQTKQWSSAQEPELSPIVGSRRGSSMAGKSSKHHNITGQASDSGMTSQGANGHGQPREPAVDTPDSMNTVIRTPHRQQSQATSAAWELFENGITFDNPGHASPPVEQAFLGHGAELGPDPGGVGTGETVGRARQGEGPSQQLHNAQGPTRDRKTHEATGDDGRASQPGARSTFRRLMSPFGSLVGKLTDASPKNSTRGGEASASSSIDAVRHRNRNLPPRIKAGTRASHAIVEMAARQQFLDLVIDGPKLRSMDVADDAWMERALRDLDCTGDRFRELASTRTITTTGFDRPPSLTETTQANSRRPRNGLFYSPPNSSLSEYNDTAIAEKTTPSASSSSPPASWAVATGTTSVTEEQVGSCDDVELLVDLRSSTSPKSTSLQEKVAVGLNGVEFSEEMAPGMEARCLAEMDEVATMLLLAESDRALKELRGGNTTQSMDPGKATAQLVTGDDAQAAGYEEKKAMNEADKQTMPGTFPAEINSDEGDDNSGSDSAKRAWISVVLGWPRALVSLYWRTILPVLDWRSDLWERSQREEMTTWDAVAVMLSMPAHLVAAFALM